jgi:hypothetical protein
MCVDTNIASSKARAGPSDFIVFDTFSFFLVLSFQPIDNSIQSQWGHQHPRLLVLLAQQLDSIQHDLHQRLKWLRRNLSQTRLRLKDPVLLYTHNRKPQLRKPQLRDPKLSTLMHQIRTLHVLCAQLVPYNQTQQCPLHPRSNILATRIIQRK